MSHTPVRDRRGAPRRAAHGLRSSSSAPLAAAVAEANIMHAVALMDHMARHHGLPGAGRKVAARRPGEAPTLAQRYGLVAAPPAKLTTSEWKAVREKSRARGDLTSRCAICLDGFGNQKQTLLSCSHVFHSTCIKSFERYAGVRVCPICRAEQYQATDVRDGRRAARRAAAVRIQAWWRGVLGRRRARELRRTRPPRDPALRRKWLEERLSDHTDRVLASLRDAPATGGDGASDLDAFLKEMDRGMSQARTVCDRAVNASVFRRLNRGQPLDESLGQLLTQRVEDEERRMWAEEEARQRAEEQHAQRLARAQRHAEHNARVRAAVFGAAQGRGGAGAAGRAAEVVDDASFEEYRTRSAIERIQSRARAAGVLPRRIDASGAASGSGEGAPRPGGVALEEGPAAGGDVGEFYDEGAGVNWDAVVARVLERGALDEDCPICMGAMRRETSDCGAPQAVAWLSCSHVFHARCLAAFETFEEARCPGGRTCPVCRGPYARRFSAVPAR
ncbi:unnamed protein product [Pedinophyceae sp. YPF-701]|nr:unnamed protein product [Pedinophyceae sp. YPF-701]